MKKIEEMTTWEDFKKEIYTEKEINVSKIRVSLINEVIKTRDEKGLIKKI